MDTGTKTGDGTMMGGRGMMGGGGVVVIDSNDTLEMEMEVEMRE